MYAQRSEPSVDVIDAPPPTSSCLAVVALRRLRSDPLGVLGLLIVLTVTICAIVGPVITPYDPFKINITERFRPPLVIGLFDDRERTEGISNHFFGTDNLGRDVFSRVLAGTRVAIGVGGGSIILAFAIGLILGLIAGYGPRWLDSFLLLLFDSIYSFPTVILGLMVMTLLGPSIAALVFIMVIIQAPGYARLVRTATLSIKSSEYILAIQSLGGSPSRILLVHILPNIVGPLLIVASMDIPAMIALEAGLTYLGLGIPPPAPSWGRILQEGFGSIREAPWIVIAGGIPLVVTTLGFTFLGEALRDLLDPKLRRIV
ncbi:ABC transporter permease [Mesorhizobium sp. M0058]|uniref:ABC transporter permease n=1 Tax=Mesorhizobium sp. M0058 TaxID=2956865 RepID=UPI003334E910